MSDRLTIFSIAAGPPRGWRRLARRAAVLQALVVLRSAAVQPARATFDDPPPTMDHVMPAEEERLDRATFRAGLKERGLTELLELHLKDFPPSGDVDGLLMQRDLKLAEFVDPTRTAEQHRRAIREANQILERLIEEHPDDPRRHDWRFDLAHALVYDEAQADITSILYRGGTPDERRDLRQLTERAIVVLDTLTSQLKAEYDRIEELTVPQFEQLERGGRVEHLDTLGSRADYLRLWALFYDALGRDHTDRTRVERLHRILEHFRQQPALLNTPHHESHVQVQALVLAGMTARRLNDYAAARRHFQQALAAADRLIDEAERARVGWAVTLAAVEQVRNDRDDGRFDQALRDLTLFRRMLNAQAGDNFGLRIAAALLERSVHRAQAAAARRDGGDADVQRYREEAWQAMAELVQHYPARRDEVYAMLTAVNGYDADLTTLDAFDQVALIAGLLFEAGEETGEGDVRLVRVQEVGQWFLEHATGAAQSLVPEVIYNMGVAQYRRGRLVEAACHFLTVARDHASWENALSAALHAVQLTANLYADPELRDHPELQQLYRDALHTLVTVYDDTTAARYWRFYYAQLLDELGEVDEAGAQYALVDDKHEHALQARFARVRCLGRAIQDLAASATADRVVLQERTSEFFTLQRAFLSDARSAANHNSGADRVKVVNRLMARAKILAAELQVLRQVDRPRQALESLADFEHEFGGEHDLAGRVWRARLLAHERLGQLDEAAKAIPAYLAADPDNAGPTLQSLYAAIAEDVDQARSAGDEQAAQRKAEVALLLATQVATWAEQHDPDASADARRRMTLQLAHANLRAGEVQRARDLFKESGEIPRGPGLPEDPVDLRAMFGLAEAQYQLGEWETALPRFNALAVGLPVADPLRFKALLRDLQCRTALQHPPRGILKVIAQQKHLYPELGGPTLAQQFEKLERENKRRQDEP